MKALSCHYTVLPSTLMPISRHLRMRDNRAVFFSDAFAYCRTHQSVCATLFSLAACVPAIPIFIFTLGGCRGSCGCRGSSSHLRSEHHADAEDHCMRVMLHLHISCQSIMRMPRIVHEGDASSSHKLSEHHADAEDHCVRAMLHLHISCQSIMRMPRIKAQKCC